MDSRRGSSASRPSKRATAPAPPHGRDTDLATREFTRLAGIFRQPGGDSGMARRRGFLFFVQVAQNVVEGQGLRQLHFVELVPFRLQSL